MMTSTDRVNSERPAGSRTGLLVAAVVLGALVVATQAVQAWSAWQQRHRDEASVLPPVRGQLSSVLLANGQVYYGEVVEATPKYVRLENVYYVQTVVDPATHRTDNRLVNRRKTDWHAPQSMVIPIDKIVMVEAVGSDSRLAQLIEQDRKRAAQPPSLPPAAQP